MQFGVTRVLACSMHSWEIWAMGSGCSGDQILVFLFCACSSAVLRILGPTCGTCSCTLTFPVTSGNIKEFLLVCMYAYVCVCTCACHSVCMYVCACVCIGMYVCTHVHVSVCMCACVWTCVHMCVSQCVYVCMCMNMCTHVCVSQCVCVCMCMNMCTHVCVTVCVCVHVYEHVYTCVCHSVFVCVCVCACMISSFSASALLPKITLCWPFFQESGPPSMLICCIRLCPRLPNQSQQRRMHAVSTRTHKHGKAGYSTWQNAWGSNLKITIPWYGLGCDLLKQFILLCPAIELVVCDL